MPQPKTFLEEVDEVVAKQAAATSVGGRKLTPAVRAWEATAGAHVAALVEQARAADIAATQQSVAAAARRAKTGR